MKLHGLVALAAIAAVAGCSTPDKTRIQCPKVDVLLTQSQLNELAIKSGADATQICEVADKIDASTFTKPTQVQVAMPSGNTYDVELQARMQ